MFRPGDRVFAKMKGFPFWPARVDPLPSHVELPKGKVPVFFYGTHQVSFLNPKNLVSFEDHKDAYGKRKVLIKAMIEIESDPEVLLLGKDPAAEAFWESLYPREVVKVERESDGARGRMSRSNSPPSKRTLKRRGSKAPRLQPSKRQKSSDQEDDLNSISSTSDIVDTTLPQGTEAIKEKDGVHQEKEEDYSQANETANRRIGRKRHHSMVECDDPIENAKRVKESELDAHFAVENSVPSIGEDAKTVAVFEINHFESPDGIAEETFAEASSDAVDNNAIQDIVNEKGEESYSARESVKGDAQETHGLTLSGAEEVGSIEEGICSDAGGIEQNSILSEYRKSQKDVRVKKVKRFVVDLDAESEDEEKYFRRCSRSDGDENFNADNDDDDYYHGCVKKPKRTDKRSTHNVKEEKGRGTVPNAHEVKDNEMADSGVVDEPRKREVSSSERESISKSSGSVDGEHSHDCKLKDSDGLRNCVVEEDEKYSCKIYGGIDNQPIGVYKPSDEQRMHDGSEGRTFSKSSESDDSGESEDKMKSKCVCYQRVMEEGRDCLGRSWRSGDESERVHTTESLDLQKKNYVKGDCVGGSFIGRGRVQHKDDNGEHSGHVRVNSNCEDDESPLNLKKVCDQRRSDIEGKGESNRRCSLKNSPRHKAKVSERADGRRRSRRRDFNDDVELSGRVSPLSGSTIPSGVGKLQTLHDLTVQLKSNLVRGHEKFSAAVDVLERICATKVSLLQLTRVWELTDCVKKCRKYRLSAEVRDAASRALAYFQRIQAAASKEEVLKAKAIVAERMRQEKSEKPSPTSAAAALVATSSIAGSPTANSFPEQHQEKKKFSLEALRAELDAKADLLLARLAATEARLMADRNKATSSPMTSSSSSTAASAVSSSRRRTEETAKDVLSRVDEVASRLGVDSGAAPPPPPPPPPPRYARSQQVDLDTRISQLMMGVITPSSRALPHPHPQSSPPSQSTASAKLLALREQIQRKRKSAATAVVNATEPHRDAMEKTADDDIYDLLGV